MGQWRTNLLEGGHVLVLVLLNPPLNLLDVHRLLDDLEEKENKDAHKMSCPSLTS